MKNREELRDVQIAAYIDMIRQGEDIYYLVSDSVSTSKVKPLRELFPDRVINTGIAEQNLIGMAAGMANGGVIPVTGNAAAFLISRSNEQLKVDISYSGSNVKVHYTGKLLNGTVFDDSISRGEPFEFRVGTGRVIQGWDETVLDMQVGEKRLVIIPPDLAYGNRSMGGGLIQPNSFLVFEMELMSFE